MPTIHIDGLPEGRTQEEKDSFEEQCIEALLGVKELALKKEQIAVWSHEPGKGKKFSVLVLGLKIHFDIRDGIERPFSFRDTIAGLLGAVIKGNFPEATFIETDVAPQGPDWGHCLYCKLSL